MVELLKCKKSVTKLKKIVITYKTKSVFVVTACRQTSQVVPKFHVILELQPLISVMAY